MKIAITGTGNVGATLAAKWAAAGHTIILGVRDTENFKGKHLLDIPGVTITSVSEAVAAADVILMATPAMYAVEIAQSLGNTEGKIIIDTMNIVMGRGPEGYNNTSQAILEHTQTRDVVKCFNSTGFGNMANPQYSDTALDMFVAGDSIRGKEVATKLALDAGFARCFDIGGNNNFTLLEQFAMFWINLAMFQGMGREIGFKLMTR